MARKALPDRAKEKARKQKIILACLGVVLVLLLVVQGPKTLKLLSNKPAAPIVAASTTTTTSAASTTPAVTPTAAPPPVAAVPPGELVSAVQPTVDTGQLREFSRFASKDPFASQAPTPSSSSTTPASTTPTSTTPKAPPAPPSPPPTSAVISLNGELMNVVVNSDFPIAGTAFSRIGSLFHLESLTKTTAKVTIVGGSYADGAPALMLTLGKPVTLQNTADGTRYTLVLEPPGTPLPGSTTSTPTATTPGSVVPAGP
jgi:hypothetical protein